MPQTVRISAYIIDWPPVCASFCRPAETTFFTSHTRTYGKEVIREVTKGFDVPYCNNCLRCSLLSQKLKEDRGRLSEVERDITLGEEYRAQGFPPLSTLDAVLRGVLTFGIYTVAREISRAQRQDLVDALPNNRRLRSELMERIAANDRDLQSSLPSGGKFSFPAMEYNGWQHTVHTFIFHNAEYARRFMLLNDRKIR